MSVSVLGAGAFGTALAISLAGKGPVTLWARDAGDMAARRENAKRLPGRPFPETLSVTESLAQAAEAETLLLAVPMQKLRSVLEEHRAALHGKHLVACCKGIELSSGVGPVRVIEETIPEATAAILTGPSFAADIARGLPTALTLACADPAAGEQLQAELTTTNLRLYRTTDTTGAELGGALKNVVAIASGAAIGAGLGESARAALMTRGYAEMQRLAAHLKAEPTTLAGLSGFGDLTLTCTSEQSRNYRLGQSLGQGTPFDPSTTVEGAATARAVDALAREAALDMPITRAVAGLLDNQLDVAGAMKSLLTRPLKEE
ncbi:NAD(P)-dependent glycerol-3-phosphate dehydrogenase [Sulfitobacter sp. KE29]|uniref:NAD(P)H-dependent glycerol-3-phosphate dehydrogenase n=1 Tax=unclassified Sulfitobacter TaxID=196795 RepID=UPI0007C2B869|nr:MULTISPECIES: NAD(P)H-dependent glycerol-3-phosphate dehydrogenase [unclassified Sulfitobacter]KZY49230.1 glycerol-3-phosphate dehydrogenase [Sulfitobacter sp. HI0054]MBO9439306.1 NAD(P)-dependent glycerol-3-phosphate dehydrogenase [Sulfitobacter sp. R18_2]MDF3417501.1 NAD(P)-dependent glycerol-3-phosphate dehydrogenase [Sulfitobacter sp. Ks38]MDF3424983.1 NAD(P)-dependent glycerol-3-phosphate dehydrogenase [Sulfitobacter sp. KE29]MDF3428564.1 NAD(P)-dependent glycerol-3-phosphate dehydroge